MEVLSLMSAVLIVLVPTSIPTVILDIKILLKAFRGMPEFKSEIDLHSINGIPEVV
jgi:hypothetical protein